MVGPEIHMNLGALGVTGLVMGPTLVPPAQRLQHGVGVRVRLDVAGGVSLQGRRHSNPKQATLKSKSDRNSKWLGCTPAAGPADRAMPGRHHWASRRFSARGGGPGFL